MNQWAPWIDDPDDLDEVEMTDDECVAAAKNAARFNVADFNPNHEPEGAPGGKGGQFAKGKGVSNASAEHQMMPDDAGDANPYRQYMTDVMWRRMSNAIKVAQSMPDTSLITGEQREYMRQDIVNKLYNRNIDQRVQGRQATIILGLPGSGKSTLGNPLLKAGAIEIDPDIAKEMIPEFNGGIGASAVHEESSAINKLVLAEAIAHGDNIVWPRIDGTEKLRKDIERLQKEGYKVNVSIIDVSPETAIRSAIDRYTSTGRLVSPSTIIEYGTTPEESFAIAKSIPGVDVARYKREYKQGVEPVADDVKWEKGLSPQAREEALRKIQKDMSIAVPENQDDQPVNDADKLIEMAKAASPSFIETIQNVAKAVNGTAVFPTNKETNTFDPVKGKKRILEKAENDYGGKVAEVKDMLRATIQTESMEDARIAAQSFIAQMGERVLRVKDKIWQVDRGYRDILINFRTENGVVSEVQFNAGPLLDVKPTGHKLFELIRSKNALTLEDKQHLNKVMDDLYDRAYDAAGDTKWLRVQR